MRNERVAKKEERRRIRKRYEELLLSLDEDILYTPASIAQYAKKNGWLSRFSLNNESHDLLKQRIRINLGRLAINHSFPDEGDGTITKKGQSPTPAWFGWRWQEVIRERREKRGE